MDTRFEALVLSGGGIKGIGTLGVIHYYVEKGMFALEHISEFAGTSIGSMLNLLLICGYSPMEILHEAYSLNSFFRITDSSNFWSLFENFGMMSIAPLMTVLEELVIKKLGKIPTMLELKKLTGKKFIVAVTNTSKKRGEYFSYQTRPNISVVDAVKISCSLPLIFHKVKYNKDYYADGGLSDNFPYGTITEGLKTLGVVIAGTGTTDESDGFIPYLYGVIMTPIIIGTQLRSKNINGSVKLIQLSFEDVPMIALNLDNDKKMKMFMKGYKEARSADTKVELNIEGWNYDEPLDLWLPEW